MQSRKLGRVYTGTKRDHIRKDWTHLAKEYPQWFPNTKSFLQRCLSQYPEVSANDVMKPLALVSGSRLEKKTWNRFKNSQGAAPKHIVCCPQLNRAELLLHNLSHTPEDSSQCPRVSQYTLWETLEYPVTRGLLHFAIQNSCFNGNIVCCLIPSVYPSPLSLKLSI